MAGHLSRPASSLEQVKDLLEQLEPEDAQDAVIQHELCYFREEVQAWITHKLEPSSEHGYGARALKRLRRREATGSLYHTWPPGAPYAHARSYLSPFPALPPPAVPTDAERGFYRVLFDQDVPLPGDDQDLIDMHDQNLIDIHTLSSSLSPSKIVGDKTGGEAASYPPVAVEGVDRDIVILQPPSR